jgi:hypothetical protein
MSKPTAYAAYHRRRQAQLTADEQRRRALREAGRITAEFARLHSDVLRGIADAGMAAAAMADQACQDVVAKH